jgi:hypothetical protein
MPKSSLFFNPSDYALVATRISLFYESHPTGRIITELVSRDRDVLFKASVYRSSADAEPAATGWALEREGDGEINEVACVENTETSAIGRALANLGFTASTKRASREEMEKAERRRTTLYKAAEARPARIAESADSAQNRSARDDRRTDVLQLVVEAGNRGMPASFLGKLERRINEPNINPLELAAIERRVRYWLLHRAKPSGNATSSTSPENVNTPHQ